MGRPTKMATVFISNFLPRLFSVTVRRVARVKINFISNSPALAGGQKWRISNGLARDGLAYGPLTDLPDWSFVDGQAAPESKRRQKRQNKRLRESQRIMQYLEEVEKGSTSLSFQESTDKT